MFLEALVRRNPDLVRAAVELHQAGEIPANSYVLDLDAIAANARAIADEAGELGVRVFAMTKQIGRHPDAIAAMREGGIDACVAVDMDCARAVAAAGSTVGHLGHLVQVARAEADEAVGLRPLYWTVFSEEKAAEAAEAASRAGVEVSLLARVHAPGDTFYSGHEGGFPADQVAAVAERLDALPGARFAGVTTFPALLFDEDAGEPRPTPNLETVARAAEALRGAGFETVEVNAPGTTSARTLRVLAEAGATQVEPGHALTGTTPWHAVAELPERPGILYLSEVSHVHEGRSYCFGGGLYIDPVFPDYQVTALVGSDPDEALGRRVDAELPPPAAIDYYGQLATAEPAGASVVFGFRAQAFVTRARIVGLRGVGAGAPSVAGITLPGGAWQEAGG